MQHTGNRRLVAACARCCGFIGSVQAQLEVVFGEARFAPLLAGLGDLPQRWQELAGEGRGNMVRCSQGCGEIYCSEACRDAHFQHSHNLLCVGPLQSEDHPLIRFKYHAIEHADTLLLAAQVLAFIVNRARSMGGGAEVTQKLMRELLCFCHAPFREACRPPPGRAKDADFFSHTEAIVGEAARLLKEALEPHAPVEVATIFQSGGAFFSEVLGMFEYNNIDVEVASPLSLLFEAVAKAFAAKSSVEPQAVTGLQQLEALLREKEWVMRCVWGEETTGIYVDEIDVASAAQTVTAPGGSAAASETDAAMEAAAEQGDDQRLATVAMSQARADVAKMSFEQLVQAAWPVLHGTALYSSVARMNHSCAPNVKVAFHGNSAKITATSILGVGTGDELCICYVDQEADVQTRRRRLLEYGFTCSCPRCQSEDSGALRKTQKRLK